MSFLKNFWRGGSSASDYRNEGETCVAHGEYDEAITDFSEAIRLDPKNVAAYIDRGLAFEEKGKYPESISDYDIAIRLAPQNAVAYLSRGNAYFALDDFHQAISDYSEAIRLDPSRGRSENSPAARSGPGRDKETEGLRHRPGSDGLLQVRKRERASPAGLLLTPDAFNAGLLRHNLGRHCKRSGQMSSRSCRGILGVVAFAA